MTDLFDLPPVGEVTVPDAITLDVDNPQQGANNTYIAMFGAPEGVSERAFREIVGAAYTAYTMDKALPSVERIRELCNMSSLTKKKIGGVLDTEQFKNAMLSRGVPWKNGSGLTGQQMYTLQILTDPSNRGDLRSKLRKASVTYQQYRAWLAQPQFSAYLNSVTEMMLIDHIPDFNTALTKKALEGDLNAIKFAYELTGRHDPNKQQVTDLKAIMQALIEIITRNVKDPATLAAISNELHLTLVSHNVVKGELNA